VFTVGQDEKYREADVEERLRDNGLFVAFAPAEDPGSRSRSLSKTAAAAPRAAAPVARKVFDAYFKAEGYVAREP
jgi:penicillin-binding protein 2